MGLRSPFEYVDYEIACGQTFVDLLKRFCSDCHTNKDYENGCKDCPAGQLIFTCKDYLLTYDESDKTYELYASKEWERKRGTPTPRKEKHKDREMAADYKPECEKLRDLKKALKSIFPQPFFYGEGNRSKRTIPHKFIKFIEIFTSYKALRGLRHEKWGFLALH